MPVGTRGDRQGRDARAAARRSAREIVLANTYHLFLRPGARRRRGRGRPARASWAGTAPILTDSGGFQVFSLADTLKVTDDGVDVPLRSSTAPSTSGRPRTTCAIQEALGADIVMQLDVCPPYPAEEARRRRGRAPLGRRGRRAARTAHTREDQALFGIVQGGVFAHLRAESVERLGELDFPGYGIGGYSVGEPHDLMLESLAPVAAALPADRPRYLMGVGQPDDDRCGRSRSGVDMFDCVLPTRTARLGTAFSSEGRLNLRNARFARDIGPLDPACSLPDVHRATRARTCGTS